MKKTLLLVLLSIFAFNANAQIISKNVSISWGDFHKEKKNTSVRDIVGHDENGFYVIKTKLARFSTTPKKVFLQYVQDNMKGRKSVELKFDDEKGKREYEFTMQSKDEIYVFSSFKNQKLKKNFLFAQSINKQTLQLNNDLKKIAEIDYSDKSKYNAGNFNYEKSLDESRVLIYYNLPYDRGDSEKFGFNVFDDKFNEIWKKEAILPYKEELFEIEDYEVDNAGNVHLLGLVYKEKRKSKRWGKPNYKYQLLSYINKGDDFKEYPIILKDKFITDMQVEVNNDLDIICAGFYSSEGTSSIEGSYFIKVNGRSRELISQSFKKFDIDFITQNMTNWKEKRTKKKATKGKDVELLNYDLDEIILRSDGGAILIGEQYSVQVVRSSTGGAGGTTTTTTTIYNYNDIIVINISPEGNIEWAEKIPKKQVTKNDGGYFSSYTSAVRKDKLYFIFNDHPNNITYDGSGRVSKFYGSLNSVTTLVTLNKEGKQSREVLFMNKRVKALPRLKVSEQISETEIVLFAVKRKKQKFAKITFKN